MSTDPSGRKRKAFQKGGNFTHDTLLSDAGELRS